jgi:hypothetical protein
MFHLSQTTQPEDATSLRQVLDFQAFLSLARLSQ